MTFVKTDLIDIDIYLVDCQLAVIHHSFTLHLTLYSLGNGRTRCD